MRIDINTHLDTATLSCDTTDMRMVHRVFRREFHLLPAMTLAVCGGDAAAAAAVAHHAREQIDALEHHHRGEDDLIWARLSERADLDGEVIARMQHQHDSIAVELAAVENLLTTWCRAPSAATTGGLAEACYTLANELDAHLDEEESDVLPAVERYLTAEEWDQVGRRGMASIPKRRLLAFLGAILEDASPAERAGFLAAHVPPPARLAYRLIGRRQYQRETATLRHAITR